MHVFPKDGIAEETYLQWKVFFLMPSEKTPRFFTPLDGEETPMDAIFDTVEEAHAWRAEMIEEYDSEDLHEEYRHWVLVEVKLRAVKWYKDT